MTAPLSRLSELRLGTVTHPVIGLLRHFITRKWVAGYETGIEHVVTSQSRFSLRAPDLISRALPNL